MIPSSNQEIKTEIEIWKSSFDKNRRVDIILLKAKNLSHTLLLLQEEEEERGWEKATNMQ